MRDRDYTGFASWQFAEAFNRLHIGSINNNLASRIPPNGMDLRDLKKIVKYQAYKFTGLHTADRITLGIGHNLSSLVRSGEIEVIPADTKLAPFKMAEDEFWAQGIEPTEDEFMARARELAELRDSLLFAK